MTVFPAKNIRHPRGCLTDIGSYSKSPGIVSWFSITLQILVYLLGLGFGSGFSGCFLCLFGFRRYMFHDAVVLLFSALR